MTCRGAFVTGAAPETGKTTVAAALAAGLAAADVPVRALKPISTGDLAPGRDATLLGKVTSHPPVSLACHEAPATPRRAARMAGEPIALAALQGWIGTHSPPGHALLIEGAGGWRTPITEDAETRDLARVLRLPVVVVAGNRPGVTSHTVLTVEAVEQVGLPVLGVVLNDAFGCSPEQAAWHRDDLRAALPGVTVLSLRRLELPTDLAPVGSWLARRLGLLD